MKYDNKGRADRSGENKKRIIESALRLINEKGFDNVSVSEITEAAGVSKGAFYIHFKTKEDLIEQEINLFYDEMKTDEEKDVKERLRYFIVNSLKHIKKSGLKMAQEWFAQGVRGGFYGKSKLAYDRKTITEIVGDALLADEIVSAYYGALNLWCFTDGEIDPETIMDNFLNNYVKEISEK